MFDVTRESLQGHEIVVLGPYKPWSFHKEAGGDGSNYPEHSGRILDVKSDQNRGIQYFFDYMSPRIKAGASIAIVPSHDPMKVGGGLSILAKKLVAAGICDDATACLVRHTKIEKLSSGGDRSVNVHIGSIQIQDIDQVRGKKIILLDDVMTTGNSLLACRNILLSHEAAEVQCLALGRTTY